MDKRVLVAMSGGVDSSAAVVLLQKQGYCCGGAMLQLHSLCDTTDAEAVASKLQIPFHIFDERNLFQSTVIDSFVSEYQQGRTPNPCIECNRCMKFGAFLDRAVNLGYDYIATGHYARVDFLNGQYRLLRGSDHSKDQSYVLYHLTQSQLSRLLLPIGAYDKPSIRKIAEDAHLLNAHKSDSQDICFIPDGDYVSFLQRQNASLIPGNFVDENGNVLGRHRGLPCYTTGQGKGLGIALGRHVYVLNKNIQQNTITLGDNERLFHRTVSASQVNWILGEPSSPLRCTAKTRYSQREAACTITPSGKTMTVTFDEPQRAMTAGQAVVLYDEDVVLGGGTIDSIGE